MWKIVLATLALFAGVGALTPKVAHQIVEQCPFTAPGVWQIVSSEGETHLITLTPSGEGIQSASGTCDHKGRWELVDDKIYTYWNDGWTDVISRVGTQFISTSYSPGTELGEDGPTSELRAEKLYGNDPAPAKPKTWGQWVIQEGCEDPEEAHA